MGERQIVSKERVNELGEVFTPSHIVNDMLDLVKDKSYDIKATFLEPACGHGNFLVEILRRKLQTVAKMDREELDKNVLIAVSSIYGIDIMFDNVRCARVRMSYIVETFYEYCGLEISQDIKKSVEYITDTNIIIGDSLVGIDRKYKREIIIAEWVFNKDNVTRKDYYLNNFYNPMLKDLVIQEYTNVKYNEIYNIKIKKEKTNSDELFDEL